MAHLGYIGFFITVLIKNIYLMILDSPQKTILFNTNNEGADQIVHMHGLISAFVIHHAHTCKMYAKLQCCDCFVCILFCNY